MLSKCTAAGYAVRFLGYDGAERKAQEGEHRPTSQEQAKKQNLAAVDDEVASWMVAEGMVVKRSTKGKVRLPQNKPHMKALMNRAAVAFTQCIVPSTIPRVLHGILHPKLLLTRVHTEALACAMVRDGALGAYAKALAGEVADVNAAVAVLAKAFGLNRSELLGQVHSSAKSDGLCAGEECTAEEIAAWATAQDKQMQGPVGAIAQLLSSAPSMSIPAEDAAADWIAAALGQDPASLMAEAAAAAKAAFLPGVCKGEDCTLDEVKWWAHEHGRLPGTKLVKQDMQEGAMD